MESTTKPVECQHPCFDCGGEMVHVEYSHDSKYHYDGISENACVNTLSKNPTCTNRKGRWCGKTLAPNEVEFPFCDGRPHPTV